MRAIQSGFLSFSWDVLAKILQFSGILTEDICRKQIIPNPLSPQMSFYLSPKFYVEK